MPGPAAGTGQSRPAGFARYLPIVSWLRSYQRSWLRGDVIGGLSVWAVAVPMALGYATISGVPVQYGLYAAACRAGRLLAVYDLEAGHRGSELDDGAGAGRGCARGCGRWVKGCGGNRGRRRVAAGLLFLVLCVLRMGWLASFMSASVLTGFMFGVAINVTAGQLFSITGTKSSGTNTWQKLWAWLSGLAEANTATVVVGVAALVLIFGLKLVAPRVPGGLVAVIAGIIATELLGLQARGVQLTAHVPRGLPSLALPNLSLIEDHIDDDRRPRRSGVMLIGVSVSTAAVREYASKHNYRVDINQEILAQGMSNVASGLFQGIFVDGSLSRSPINDQAGARSQLSNLVQAVLVVLTLLLLGPAVLLPP